MEPQPQLQPIAPRPQLDYAEPTGRPIELKPGPRPIDLRPRPTGRQPLDIKYGPASPAEAAAQRANPLGNPLNVTQPVVNNPLGYAPGKGLVGAAAALIQNAADPSTFGVPAEEFLPSETPALPLPNQFPPDAIAPGPEIVEGQPEIPGSGNDPTASYTVTAQGQPYSGTSTATSVRNGNGSVGGLVFGAPTAQNATAIGISFSVSGNVFSGSGTASTTPSKQGTWSITNIQRLSPGTDPPAQEGADPVLSPNRARSAGAPEDIAPSARPSPPLKPAPVPFLDRPKPDNFIPYSPPITDPGPEIRPARPGQPGEPRKLPPVPTIPRLPGGDTDAPSAPTKRPPPVEFPPVAPGTTGRELDPPRLPPLIPIFIPPLKQDDCATGDQLRREAGSLRDLIEDILDRILNDCKDLCGEAQLTRAFCEEVNGELQPRQEFITYDTLGPALGFLSREIAAIKSIADPCGAEGAESVPPVVLGSGSMIEGNTVAYVDILPEVRQVELIITGQIPNNLRLYDSTLSGEQQGKFGAITLAYPGVTGGNAPDAFHQWAWTRRTSFYVGPPIRNDRRIRINLKPLLTWVLYDTGLRS